MPRGSVVSRFGEATASMAVEREKVRDWFNVINALTGGASIPPVRASVSFDIEWSGDLGRSTISDDVNDFTAHLIQDTATMTWTARSQGVFYRSVGDSENLTSEIGRERSGVFND